VTGRRVVVIGGGLSGITAAMALRDAGAEVTLLESRPWLGGAASSYARGSLMVDNGQHVFLRCCTAYRDLLARLGVTGSVAIQDRFDVTVLSPGGETRLRRSLLPSPLHLAGALARYPLLTLAERARVGRAALAFRFADPASPALDSARLGDWLAARGQDEQTRRKLWDLFIVSTLNIAGDDASVPLAATVIRTALLGARDAADIGMATVPLGRLHGTAGGDLLARLGATVRLGTRVASVERRPGGGFRVGLTPGHAGPPAAGGQAAAGLAEGGVPAEGPLAEGGVAAADESIAAAAAAAPGAPGVAALGESGELSLEADGVVLAVPAGQAARLSSAAGAGADPAWAALGTSPIVNVHVLYEQRVTRLPFAAGVDSPVQWVFDKTRQAGLESGQYLAVSLSAADRYVDMPVAALREEFLPALEQLFPAAGGTEVTDFFVTRERRATFRQAPGCVALRPGAATSVSGLVLAGAWTDTGWPDTMEGAVRSGHNAAQELMRELAAVPSAGRADVLDPAGQVAS
jgi:protoporphyrinogen oxidase